MLPENQKPAETPAQMRGRIAGLARIAKREKTLEAQAAVQRARAEYAAARLEEAIQRTAAEWPPLDHATIDRLALLLRGGDAA